MNNFTVGLYTLGCKVSQYETEAIAESFEARGFTVGAFDGVNDVYVINTCTVTAEADRKSRQMIRRAKKRNPDSVVIVCGCYSQRSPDEVEAIPDVDAVIGSSGKLSIVGIAEELLKERRRIVSVTDVDSEPFECMRITKGPRTRVYVKIEDGCECRCTYCAIPSARGRVRSKPRRDVIEEVEALAESGVREIVLTGIETGSYGRDFSESYSLADLIAELDSRGSCERIRLGSLAPELIGEEFLKKVRDVKILAPHFHLSMQSGSSSVLRAMKRRYSREMALENIALIRKAFPRATFTTDVMVGFPGETEEDFLESVSLIREVGFLDAHVFAYSRRKDTPAASYPCQIPENVKRERSERLIEAVREVRRGVLDAIVSAGEPMPVIFEECVSGLWRGHSDTFVPVEVCFDGELHGECRIVQPVSRNSDIIVGKIV